MADQNANPYSSPRESGHESLGRQIPGQFSKGARIAAGIASVGIFLVACVGYMAWAIADSYFISEQPHFYAVLVVSIGLGMIAVFWMFFAVIGHNTISKTVSIWGLGITAVLAIPASIFVLWFFF